MLIVASNCIGCSIAKIEFNYVGTGFLYRPSDRATFEKEIEIMAKSKKNELTEVNLLNDKPIVAEVPTVVPASVAPASVAPASVAPASTQKGFIPKSWREVVGKLEPTAQPSGPIVANEVVTKLGTMANERIHNEFTKHTIGEMLTKLDGKIQFTLQELAEAAGFDDRNRLNQIVGSASFRIVLRSLMLGGRIIAAPKGRGASAATSVEAIKAASNALGEI
jgi:hypothetical protein